MACISTEVSIADNNITSSKSAIIAQKLINSSRNCKICGAPAFCINYGVITCPSCKVFFRRYAEKGQVGWICNYGNHCEINVLNRHICRACRLAKCFVNKMQIARIRYPSPKRKTTKQKKKVTDQRVKTTCNALVTRAGRDQFHQFPTLSLLRSDKSKLSIHQWNQISNLVHCYDEYGGASLAERFKCEQNCLPIKVRFKIGPIDEFIRSTISRIQEIFEKNGDYLSLCSQDRSILLRNTIKHTGCVGSTYALHQVQLLANPYFYKSAAIIFGSHSAKSAKRMIGYFDSNDTFAKLSLSILAFSTISYTVYENIAPVNLLDIKTIIRIQDSYTKLLWQYLVYKYSHEQAVKCFSRLLRCLFTAHHIIGEYDRDEKYKNIIDTVVEQTEKRLILNH